MEREKLIPKHGGGMKTRWAAPFFAAFERRITRQYKSIILSTEQPMLPLLNVFPAIAYHNDWLGTYGL